jgi:hypothetical protein
MIDGNPLLPALSKELGLVPAFHARDRFGAGDIDIGPNSVAIAFHTVDPTIEAPPWVEIPEITVGHQKLLALKLASIRGQAYTVKDVVKLASNELGGVHFGMLKPDAPPGELAARQAVDVNIAGIGASVVQLQPLIAVIVRGLEPLEAAARAR